MPTALPRVIVYDPAKSHHITVVVRHDLGYITAFCADCETEWRGPIDNQERLTGYFKERPDMQVVSWLEVVDNGD